MSETLQRVKDEIDALVTKVLRDAVECIQDGFEEGILEALGRALELKDSERAAQATQQLDAAVAANQTCPAYLHMYAMDASRGSPSLRVCVPWDWLPEAWYAEREDEVLQYFTCPLLPLLEALLYEVCADGDAETVDAVLAYLRDALQRFETGLRYAGMLPPLDAHPQEDTPA